MSKRLSQQFSFTVPTVVSDICNPLTKSFGANFIIYQKSIIDEEAKCVSSNAYLCNNTEALEYILSIPQKNREPAKYDYSDNRKYVLIESTQPIFAGILRDKFNFNNILCRDEQIGLNEWEHFIIGTASSDTTIINSYLNNIELLDKFVAYFRDKAAKLIDKACDNGFASGRPIEKCNFRNPYNLPNDQCVENFSTLPDPRHYYLINQYAEKVVVPKAEMHCLIMLSQGRSAKEIARTLGISSRTVESHIKIAKFRLKCDTKSCLLNTLEKWKKSNTWVQ